MALKPTPTETPATDPAETPEEETLHAAEVLPAGWHVQTGEGVLCGVYPTEADAEAFATGHLIPQGITYTISEIV